ncbi:HD domain-containing protein [Teredinibacter turnerae]|uniref:phosphorylase family protein n=1 Tax=Teredinibacter turnerae TaxID=2426 RepID=UPI000368368F|nr:HD domain-containing protein [Teredinibacter turnerae]
MKKHVLAVIALKEEFDVFLREFPIVFSGSRTYDGIQEGTYVGQEESITFFVYCMFDMTSIESYDATLKWLDTLQPDIVLSIGIAGGLWDQQNMSLGDVVIAQSSTEVAHSGKMHEQGFSVGGKTENTDESLEDCFKKLSNGNIFDRELQCRVLFGPIATTPYVIADKKTVSNYLAANRNFHAVDMESYGVGRAVRKKNGVKFWAVKGVSDFSDKDKSVLEATTKGLFRVKAMENSVKVASLLIQKETNLPIRENNEISSISMSEMGDQLRKNGNRDIYDALTISQNRKKYCEKYLSHLIDTYSIDDLVEYITTGSEEDKSMSISGRGGCGITSVLTGLGVKLLEKGLSTFYLNLKDFTLRKDDRSSEKHISEKIEKGAIDVFILDGWDGIHENRRLVAEAIQEIIGDAGIIIVYGFKDDGVKEFFPPSVEREFYLNRLDKKWVVENEDVINSIFQPKEPEEFWRQVNLMKNIDPDPMVLNALATMTVSSEFELIENYCKKRVNNINRKVVGPRFKRVINQASAIAYNHFKKITFNPEKDGDETLEVRSSGRQENVGLGTNAALACDLAFSHESVAHYLVANHVINNFVAWENPDASQRMPVVPEVFPQSINYFCKSIIQNDERKQRAVVSAIANILDSSVHPYMKAHGCYLLGRVTDSQLRSSAEALLEKTVRNPIYIDGEDKPILMVGRSAYISLTYLEKESMAIEYINKLFNKESWDRLNRGFHLEYYGDRDYDPNRPLESMDDLGSWEKTYNQLVLRAKKFKDGDSTIVDLHTLFSLGYHRHKQNLLDFDKKRQLIDIGNDLYPKLGRYSNLNRYICRCVESMDKGNDPDIRLFAERYSLQFKKRTGYTARGLLMGQSIADHIMGAVTIAEHYLKERYESENAYSKRRVVELVRHHDDGEGRSGDYRPDDSDKSMKKKLENEYFQDLRLISGNFESYAEHPMLWDEFKTAETINSRVAHDIDKLENYLCLRIYENMGFVPNDLDSWIQDLESSLTVIGDTVYQQIKSEETEIITHINELFEQNSSSFVVSWIEHIKDVEKNKNSTIDT